MGLMTLTNFRDEVRYRLGARTDLTTARLRQWVNWAYGHVTMPSVHEHRAVQVTGTPITLVQGTNEYDVLPITVNYITSVSYPTRRATLNPVDINWMDRRDLTVQAQPSHYALYGESSAGATRIFIYPTPSLAEVGKTLTIRGVKVPDLLTAEADRTVLHTIWDEAITLGAVWRGWRDLGLPQAVEAREEFAVLVNDITNQQRFEGKQDPPKFSVETQRYQQ